MPAQKIILKLYLQWLNNIKTSHNVQQCKASEDRNEKKQKMDDIPAVWLKGRDWLMERKSDRGHEQSSGNNSYAKIRAELGAVGSRAMSHVCKLQTWASLSQSIVWHVHVSLCLETPKAYPKKRWDLHNTILYIWWVSSLGSTWKGRMERVSSVWEQVQDNTSRR